MIIVNAVRNNLFEQNLNQMDKEKYKNNCMQYGYILITAILIFCCSWFYKCSCCCCPGSHQQKAGSQEQHPTEKGSTPFCMSTPHHAFLCMSKPLCMSTPHQAFLSLCLNLTRHSCLYTSTSHQAFLSVYIYTSPGIPLCMSKLQQTFLSIHPTSSSIPLYSKEHSFLALSPYTFDHQQHI